MNKLRQSLGPGFSATREPAPQIPFVGLLLLSISVFLSGCADIVRHNTDQITPTAHRELTALFGQPYIDPLTRYLKEHGKDASHTEDLSRVRKERDRRCGEVARRYREAPATTSTLAKLERGYRYSCPRVVDAFAERVAVIDTPGPVEVSSAVEHEAAENCYLLFGIKNYREARAACESPAMQGDARSQYNLGIIFGTLSDNAMALKWTRLAVAQGLPEAELYLGRMYHYGQGLDRDDREALRLFRQAGEQGLAEAQYRAGMGYYNAKGTEQKYSEAREWLERAADQGLADAQARLGEMYALGKGTKVDGAHAKNWLQRAAEQGVVEAQYRLGLLYSEGNILPRDETQAYVWLSVAALAGNRDAEVQRDRVARSLDPERIVQSQRRIRRIVEQRR